MVWSIPRRLVSEHSLIALALLASTALTAPAYAQAQAGPTSTTPPTGQVAAETGGGDVIVTAQKRVERNVNVPISITVNTARDIAVKNIGDLTQLAEKMPNVNGGGTFFANFTIRGITSSSAGSGFPPDVGVNVDEVFMGRDRMFDTVLDDVASVELLRGPQGTLYGKNTIAGVINITTIRPTDEFVAKGDAEFGSLNFVQLRGTVSGPIIDDKLMASISGSYQSRDGFINDPVLHEKLGSLGDYGGRMMVVAKPDSNLTIELRADAYTEDDTSGQNEVQSTITGSTLPFPPFNTVPKQNPYDRIVDVNTMPVVERSFGGASAKVEYDYANYAFTSITAWRQLTSDFDLDQDGGPLDGFDTGQGESVGRFSQEFRITSPAGERFSWIAGAYFDDETDHDIFHIHLGDGFPTPILGAPALPPGFSERAVANAKIRSQSEAGFVSIKYDITPKLKFTGGVRYTAETKHLDFVQMPTQMITMGSPLGGIIDEFALPIPFTTDSYSGSAPTGDANLSYSFTPDAVGYLRYSHGYKAGGFQSDIISPPFVPSANAFRFKPEFLDDYEVGFKSVLFDHKLTFDISAFYYNFTNKQEEVNTGVSFVVSNAASAVSKGLEADINWTPISGLDLFANGGYLDAYYNNFPNGGGLGINFSGHQLAGASKYSASWGGTYTVPLNFWSGKDFTVETDFDYRSKQFTDPANTEAQAVEPFIIMDARAGVQSEDGRWGVYVWGKNLTDDTVLGGGVDVLGGLYIERSINLGRTVGVELRGRF